MTCGNVQGPCRIAHSGHFKLICKSALIHKRANIQCLGKAILFLKITKKRLNHGISQNVCKYRNTGDKSTDSVSGSAGYQGQLLQTRWKIDSLDWFNIFLYWKLGEFSRTSRKYSIIHRLIYSCHLFIWHSICSLQLIPLASRNSLPRCTTIYYLQSVYIMQNKTSSLSIWRRTLFSFVCGEQFDATNIQTTRPISISINFVFARRNYTFMNLENQTC